MANLKDVLRTQRWLGCDAARRTQQFTSDYNSFMRYPRLGGAMDCHAPTGLPRRQPSSLSGSPAPFPHWSNRMPWLLLGRSALFTVIDVWLLIAAFAFLLAIVLGVIDAQQMHTPIRIPSLP